MGGTDLKELLDQLKSDLSDEIKGLRGDLRDLEENLGASIAEQSQQYRKMHARVETLEIFGLEAYSPETSQRAAAFLDRWHDPGRSKEDGATDPGYSVYPESTDWN